MADYYPVGIDLNGLQDAAVFEPNLENIVGGAIPSVVLASFINGRPTLMAGKEATLAFDGRGWIWPYEAKADNSSTSRVPVTQIIDHLVQRKDINLGGQNFPPEEMIAEAIKALATTRTVSGHAEVIVAIPDDGRFDEDIQQLLLNATRASGVKVKLLWRSVAAILGMANELAPVIKQLDGKEVAVISCLEDGVSVSRLQMGIGTEGRDDEYVVPKRTNPGVWVPYEVRVTDLAMNCAETIATSKNIDPWQVLWGDGLPLRWILNEDDRDAFLQANDGWLRVPGKRPDDFFTPEPSAKFISKINETIQDVGLVVYEGPAVQMPTASLDFMFHIRDALKEEYFQTTGQNRTTLVYSGLGCHLAALGCYEFGRRHLARETTYLDHLPQLRLAVRRENEPSFKDLIPATDECVGGEEYNKPVDLAFSIPQGAKAVEFYLHREGDIAFRHAREPLKAAVAHSTPIRMRIRQTPAQGRAQLSVEAQQISRHLPSIAISWARMEVLEGMTEADIIETLKNEEVFVPPVQPHPCHAFLWLFKRRGQLLALSLSDQILRLIELCTPTGPLPLDDISSVRSGPLTRFQSPSILTRSWGPERHASTQRARAISSDGQLPDPSDGLTKESLGAFDNLLSLFADRFTNAELSSAERNQIVTFCTWAFTRCPKVIREYLCSAAEQAEVASAQHDFFAMGRAFSEERELKAFFHLLEKNAVPRRRLMNYHANGLFNVLSLRENAPKHMTLEQAREFTKLALAAIDQEISARRYSGLMRISLRAIGGLIRYRLVDGSFLAPDEFLGVLVQKTIKKVVDRCQQNPNRRGVKLLAEAVLTVLEKRGVPDTILQWDGVEDENETDNDTEN